jgi:outer membrane protein OmpA-like peptidoglycan-associated protein
MRILTSLLLVLWSAACTPKAGRVILVPDRDGHVGVVTVTNAKGSTTLDAPGQGVTVLSGRSPGAPEAVPPSAIQAIFGDALAVEPQAAAVFIVYFPTGSADIDEEGARALEQAVAEIARRQSVDVSVDGHTDTAGDPDVNMKLSLGRAEAVRDRLVRAGVAGGVVTVRYHGKGILLVPTGDNVAEPRNRRVEVVVR